MTEVWKMDEPSARAMVARWAMVGYIPAAMAAEVLGRGRPWRETAFALAVLAEGVRGGTCLREAPSAEFQGGHVFAWTRPRGRGELLVAPGAEYGNYHVCLSWEGGLPHEFSHLREGEALEGTVFEILPN